MPVTNPRTRLISFRVSEHEYARLRTLSNAQGAHSLADFIRASVCFMMECVPHGIGRAAGGNSLPSPLGEIRPSIGMIDDPGIFGSDPVSGQLFGLRVKAEALDREVRRLITMIEGLGSAQAKVRRLEDLTAAEAPQSS